MAATTPESMDKQAAASGGEAGAPATQLPYTLRRPLIAFFRVLTWAWLLSSLGAALLIPTPLVGGVAGFVLVFVVGGSLWLGIAISAACSRQSITLYDDRLELQSFGRAFTLEYRDVVNLNVECTTTGRTVTLTLFVEVAAGRPTLPEVNLMLFAARDRALLLNTLSARVPNLQLNEAARQVQAGRKFWY
jgi:hypothetical protein